ncbi:10442_t:CDS:2, partial [Gigaspora rosea]
MADKLIFKSSICKPYAPRVLIHCFKHSGDNNDKKSVHISCKDGNATRTSPEDLEFDTPNDPSIMPALSTLAVSPSSSPISPETYIVHTLLIISKIIPHPKANECPDVCNNLFKVSNPIFLRSIYRWYDGQGHSTNVFRDMINGFGKLAAEKPQLIGHLHQGRESMDMSGMAGVVMGGVGQVDSPGLSIANSVMKIQCIDQLDKAEPPQIPETYLYYLAFVCLNSIADGLHNFVSSIFAAIIQKQQHDESQQTSATQQQSIFGNTALQQLESHPEYKEVLLVADMANTAWPGLLAAQSFFLTANLDEELFQGVLRAYQNFTIVCGVLRLSTPCDAFLTSLCKGAVPPSIIAAYVAESKAVHSSGNATGSGYDGTVMVTLSDRNLSCLKILLNIAQYLGGVLGDSWYLVLETLQLADFIIFPKHARGGSRGTRKVSTQHSASVSTSSLSSPQTAGSSSSLLSQSASTAPVKRPYSGIIFSSQHPTQSSQSGLSAANLASQQTAIENDLNILLVQIKKLFLSSDLMLKDPNHC